MAIAKTSLRRRSPRSGTKQGFKVGDVVQIVTSTGVEARGRLMYRHGDGKHSNRKWLVRFDGTQYSDEDVFETSFRSSGSDNAEEHKHASSSYDLRSCSSSSLGTTSSGESVSELTTAAGEFPPTDDNQSVDTKSSEEKGRRGRNGISREPTEARVLQDSVSKSSVCKREGGGKKKRKKAIGRKVRKGTTSAQNANTAKEEEVVKIKMNTGTLYLYRGSHPRAKFVRSWKI